MSATVAGEIDVNKGMFNNKDSEEERMYARLGLDPADEELIRRSSGSNSLSSQRAREQAWEKMQMKKAKATRAKRKGMLDPNKKYDSEEQRKKEEEEARLKAEAEAKLRDKLPEELKRGLQRQKLRHKWV